MKIAELLESQTELIPPKVLATATAMMFRELYEDLINAKQDVDMFLFNQHEEDDLVCNIYIRKQRKQKVKYSKADLEKLLAKYHLQDAFVLDRVEEEVHTSLAVMSTGGWSFDIRLVKEALHKTFADHPSIPHFD